METEELEKAIRHKRRVEGLTHGLYRYPARFSPHFARAAIDTFSDPGDWVLDPFVGGGTTVVEALALGRRVAGIDLNPLAILLTRAKSTPLYQRDVNELRRWLGSGSAVNESSEDQRLKNAPAAYVSTLAPLVATTTQLPRLRQRDMARALLLHVGQWALDGKERPAPASALRAEIDLLLTRHLDGLSDFVDQATSTGLQPSDLPVRRVLREGSAAVTASGRPWNRLTRRFRLVLTSPPYPQVHVLYHRWQIYGRLETPFAYWLAGSNDGLGASHYTMGGRSDLGENVYFDGIAETFSSIRRLLLPKAFVVQLVSFHDPIRQKHRYLEAMETAGYEQVSGDGPSLREVPNRRWYYRVRPDRGRAHEYLLVHRLKP